MSSFSLVSLAEVCRSNAFVRASNRRSLYACQRVMNAEPPGFDRAALYAALREWELSITSLSYLPLGAGSHHYLARDAGEASRGRRR